jgi:hypothetical protein
MSTAASTAHSLSDNFVGSLFLRGFSHQAIADPHTVECRFTYRLSWVTYESACLLPHRTYVSEAVALKNNLTYANGNTYVGHWYLQNGALNTRFFCRFIIRADYKNTLSALNPGCPGVRIWSNKQYTHHVLVYDDIIFTSINILGLILSQSTSVLISVMFLKDQGLGLRSRRQRRTDGQIMVRSILSKGSIMLGKIFTLDFSFGLIDSIRRITARILLR